MTQAVLTLNDTVETSQNEAAMTLFQVLGGSLLIALCAQIKIPLFFTPVPLSLQTLAVMIVAGFLGRKKGTLCVVTYLAQLSMGLPVGAGGAANSLALLGPTGGYLIGFVLQAYLVGWCAEKKEDLSPLKMFSALFSISFIQMGMGALWLGLYVGFENAMMMGFTPFIPGDFLKVLAATTFIAKSHSAE